MARQRIAMLDADRELIAPAWRIKRLRQARRDAVERGLDIDDEGDDLTHRTAVSVDYALGRSDYSGYRAPRFLALAGIILAPLSTATGGSAMTFEVWNVGGEPAIIGDGEIRDGDATRLENVLTKEARHSAGYFALALNSPGGSVKPAFDLARVIDAYNINVYVPSHFVCVSACAAFVFISGREHVVLPGGRLGFHGCYDSRTKEIVDLCNDAIAQHALEYGTAYGSVMAFIRSVPHDEIIWFNSEQADCWAISRYEITSPPPNFEQCVFEAIRGAAK
jgi:hypothetical protein